MVDDENEHVYSNGVERYRLYLRMGGIVSVQWYDSIGSTDCIRSECMRTGFPFYLMERHATTDTHSPSPPPTKVLGDGELRILLGVPYRIVLNHTLQLTSPSLYLGTG